MMRIPKIIHFCWLSDDPFPANIQECIDSWKRVLPDYEIIKWDRKRFDIESVPYVKEAYEAKKYAFCADYIRIYALYHYGGIYLDSDVMVYKSFEPFLNLHSFSSVEFHSYFLYAHISNKQERLVGIEAAVLGAEKGASWLKDVLEYYNGRHFSLNSKELKKNIMPRVIARVLHTSNITQSFRGLPMAWKYILRRCFPLKLQMVALSNIQLILVLILGDLVEMKLII